MSVCTLLMLSKIHNLHTKSIDFTLLYSQADFKVPIYFHTPQGILLDNGEHRLVQKLLKKLYRLKDVGRTWFEHLSEGLLDMRFLPTETDQCVFIKDCVIILIYVNDCIIFLKRIRELKKLSQLFKNDMSSQMKEPLRNILAPLLNTMVTKLEYRNLIW